MDSIATVSTPHSASQSARRYKSAVNAANSRTGCSQLFSGTDTKWLLAPTSTPAAPKFTRESSAGRRSRLLAAFTAGLALQLYVLIVPSAITM